LLFIVWIHSKPLLFDFRMISMLWMFILLFSSSNIAFKQYCWPATKFSNKCGNVPQCSQYHQYYTSMKKAHSTESIFSLAAAKGNIFDRLTKRKVNKVNIQEESSAKEVKEDDDEGEDEGEEEDDTDEGYDDDYEEDEVEEEDGKDDNVDLSPAGSNKRVSSLRSRILQRSTSSTELPISTTKSEKTSRKTVKANANQNNWYDQVGPHPTNPDFQSGFITIVGNPNVGKSTLMNTLMRQNLSIVNQKPQTTRHRILGIFTTDDYQLILTDTPGMLVPKYKLHSSMQNIIRNSLLHDDAEGIVIMSDVYCEPLADEKVLAILNNSTAPIIVVINKLDLLDKRPPKRITATANPQTNIDEEARQLLNDNNFNVYRGPRKNDDAAVFNRTMKSWDEIVSFWQQQLPQAEIIGISAKTQYNIPVLVEHIVALLPKGPLYYSPQMTSDRDERFFTSEIIRECILSLYKDEIPYSCEVRIDSFKDKTPKFSEIFATIIVNRPSQIGIIVGKEGSMARKLGTIARKKIEEMLDRRTYLSMKVEVDAEWRDNVESLKRYGYDNRKNSKE